MICFVLYLVSLHFCSRFRPVISHWGPFGRPQELIDVLVLVIRLHHPDALLAEPSHDREDTELWACHSKLDLLLDGND